MKSGNPDLSLRKTVFRRLFQTISDVQKEELVQIKASILGPSRE